MLFSQNYIKQTKYYIKYGFGCAEFIGKILYDLLLINDELYLKNIINPDLFSSKYNMEKIRWEEEKIIHSSNSLL